MNCSGKILFVCHEASRTGAPMFLLHLLSWLKANRPFKLEILLAAGGPLESEFANIAPVFPPSHYLRPDAWKQVDLIYSNTCCNGLLLESLPCGGIPIVTHFHELNYGYEMIGARRLAAVTRHTNHYIACAEAVATQLTRCFNVPASAINVFHEFIAPEKVDAAVTTTEISAARARLNLPPDAQIVLACGTFDWRKAPDLFVQVAARMKRRHPQPERLRFLWIGKVNDRELFKRLAYDIKIAELENSLQIVGELVAPHAVFALADVFCLTSREDPFPLAMLEAAALGKPVVCFENAGGAKEFCDHGGGIAVPFLDSAAMAEACLELVNQPELREKTGSAGRDSVKALFTVDVIAPKVSALIARLLHDRPAANPLRDPAMNYGDVFNTWSLSDSPNRVLVEAQIKRHRVRAEVNALRLKGRSADALRLCISLLQQTAQTCPPDVILDTVVEIADDMRAIDRAKSESLLADAEKMARSGGMTLEQLRNRLNLPNVAASNVRLAERIAC